MDNKNAIEVLFQKYLDDRCDAAEINRLLSFFGIENNEEKLNELILYYLESKNSGIKSRELSEEVLNQTFEDIKLITGLDTRTPAVVRPLPFYKNKWFRLSAAAVVFLMISYAVLFVARKNDHPITAQQQQPATNPGDIQPGKNNAVLTLDDGSVIVLDSAANGALARQGNTTVLKINGQVAYEATAGSINSKPVYNTISTANGNQYQLVLSDGSKVWLNAASSIRFPASFSGNERKVQIKGEAYFEVAKDAKKPFKVEFDNASGGYGEIEVLGTHFNVNAYPEEPDVKTTLLEGSVKVRKENDEKILSPGQQAKVSNGKIILNKNIDVSQVVAWKDGFFIFNDVDIHTLMRQVQRWYDVEVTFEGKISEEGFTGRISRDVPLSQFLKALEFNDVHTKTQGRRVQIKF